MKLFCICVFLLAFNSIPGWLEKKDKGFVTYYKPSDSRNIDDYNWVVRKGIQEVTSFFSSNFKNEFAVYIHPDRKSLDSTWQHDWKMPEFKSECWMVASGVADRLDMISPVNWASQSCEHDYSKKDETQRLITHELVHVYHSQFNKTADFNEMANMDWFVEGLAVYASGQLTNEKLSELKKWIQKNGRPSSLNDFWKGRVRYQLSGAAVKYIDKTFGRKKLISLLPLNKKSQVLSLLNTSEDKFLHDWENDILK